MVRLRRFRWSDLDGLLAVRNAGAVAEASQSPSSREGLAAHWSQGSVRAERDLWVVEGQENILAYGGLRPWHSPGWLQVEIAVLPAWQDQGLGDALLRRLVGDARQRATTYLCAVAGDEPAAASRFLLRNGFQPLVARQHMRLRPIVVPPVRPVPGFALRLARLNDCAALAGVNNAAYATGERSGRADEAGYRRFIEESGARVWVATESAVRIVGLCEVRETEATLDGAAAKTGHIGSLAVLPSHRRRGLGAWLLAQGVALCQEAGRPSVELNVDRDNVPALQLYMRSGFQSVYTFTVYRLALP